MATNFLMLEDMRWQTTMHKKTYVFFLQTLLSASGKCIRDLNYYSVTTLQAKVQLLKNENMQLQLRATFLYDQLRQRTKSNEWRSVNVGGRRGTNK